MPEKKNLSAVKLSKANPTLSREKILILRIPVNVRPKCGTVDSPEDFFAELTPYMLEWLTWAGEVNSCWDARCGNEDFRKGLQKLCKDFRKWAEDAKKWGDEVEDCFQTECNEPPDHTTPPPPPF